MKPVPFNVMGKRDGSFHVQINRQPHQYDKLHVHPEYQISLVVAGAGACTIGGYTDRFRPGDMYIIGPDTPHVFRNDREHYQAENPAPSHFVSVFFRESSFGRDFFRLPEMAAIQDFLHYCTRGVKLGPRLAEALYSSIRELAELTGATRIIRLLSILNQIALSADLSFLTGPGIPVESPSYLYPRLNRIFQYIADNFDQPISLNDAARVANLSRHAFCRFFKRSTHKSFIHYLNEFRVGMACRLLRRSSYTITQIGLQTGFNNLSYFNRQFKKFMHCTPGEYRELRRELT